MALKLAAPIEKEFTLDETDQHYCTEGTRVTIRQAAQAQHERRSNLFATLTREYLDENEDGVVRLVQRFNLPELMRMEAYLTLVESNIEDENGSPLFRPGMSESQFAKSWGKLPQIAAYEIHKKVLEVNPDWKPAGE